MSASLSNSRLHLGRIDVLRAVAILMVFGHHYWLILPHSDNASLLWTRLICLPLEAGYLGVKLFFVVSGFCIHLSALHWLDRSSPGNATVASFIPRFLWRRFWRIYPPYLGALLAFYVMQYRNPFEISALRHLAVHVALTQTISEAFFYNLNPSFWSIAVEWQLYLVYPVFFWMRLRWDVERAFLFASGVALVFQLLLPNYADSFWLKHLPFAYWLEWVSGALVADYFFTGRRLFPTSVVVPLMVAATTILAFVTQASTLASFLLPTLLFAIVVERSVCSVQALACVERWLVPVGLSSYSFYLWHQPLLQFALSALPRPVLTPPVSAIVAVFLWLLLAVLSWAYYRVVELGSIKIGRSLWAEREA